MCRIHSWKQWRLTRCSFEGLIIDYNPKNIKVLLVDTLIYVYLQRRNVEAEIKLCVHEAVFVVNLELILGWKAWVGCWLWVQQIGLCTPGGARPFSWLALAVNELWRVSTTYFDILSKVLKLNASTKTRSTTRCSGDLMGDQMAPGRPDRSWATRLLTKLAMSCCLLGKYQGLLNKSELKQASLDDQIAPGDQIGQPDFHILVTSKIWSPIWSPGAIWSPIWSPERLVVDLVVVDAVTYIFFFYWHLIRSSFPLCPFGNKLNGKMVLVKKLLRQNHAFKSHLMTIESMTFLILSSKVLAFLTEATSPSLRAFAVNPSKIEGHVLSEL